MSCGAAEAGCRRLAAAACSSARAPSVCGEHRALLRHCWASAALRLKGSDARQSRRSCARRRRRSRRRSWGAAVGAAAPFPIAPSPSPAAFTHLLRARLGKRDGLAMPSSLTSSSASQKPFAPFPGGACGWEVAAGLPGLAAEPKLLRTLSNRVPWLEAIATRWRSGEMGVRCENTRQATSKAARCTERASRRIPPAARSALLSRHLMGLAGRAHVDL